MIIGIIGGWNMGLVTAVVGTPVMGHGGPVEVADVDGLTVMLVIQDAKLRLDGC